MNYGIRIAMTVLALVAPAYGQRPFFKAYDTSSYPGTFIHETDGGGLLVQLNGKQALPGLMRLGPDGAYMWTKFYDFGPSIRPWLFNSFLRVMGGESIIWGTTIEDTANGAWGVLTMMDMNGVPRWTKRFVSDSGSLILGREFDHEGDAHYLVDLPQGGCCLLGEYPRNRQGRSWTDGLICVTKLAAAGRPDWSIGFNGVSGAGRFWAPMALGRAGRSPIVIGADGAGRSNVYNLDALSLVELTPEGRVRQGTRVYLESPYYRVRFLEPYGVVSGVDGFVVYGLVGGDTTPAAQRLRTVPSRMNHGFAVRFNGRGRPVWARMLSDWIPDHAVINRSGEVMLINEYGSECVVVDAHGDLIRAVRIARECDDRGVIPMSEPEVPPSGCLLLRSAISLREGGIAALCLAYPPLLQGGPHSYDDPDPFEPWPSYYSLSVLRMGNSWRPPCGSARRIVVPTIAFAFRREPMRPVTVPLPVPTAIDVDLETVQESIPEVRDVCDYDAEAMRRRR